MRSEAWDGSNLKFTFRRTMDSRLMRQWEELLQVAESIEFREDDEDAIIWQFESLEDIQFNHFMQLLIIGGGGVKQIFTPVVWKIVVKFLWSQEFRIKVR
jgi:hypothetical protein